MSLPDELQFLLDKSPSERELALRECLGSLVLMMHWQRGAMAMLFEALKDKRSLTAEEQQNWERINKNLALYEEFVWEVAPSRALVVALRHWRSTGEVLDDVELLTRVDEHGRLRPEKELLDLEPRLQSVSDDRQNAGYYGHAYSLLSQEDDSGNSS